MFKLYPFCKKTSFLACKQSLLVLLDMLTMICCVLQALTDGYFFPPTVITGLADNSRCMKDEIFGPVVCLTKVIDFETLVGPYLLTMDQRVLQLLGQYIGRAVEGSPQANSF